jgi:hypothetical protein
MKEIFGDIFTITINGKSPDAICIPTNGIVKSDNSLVMGKGVAKLFRDKYLGIDLFLGKLVKIHGNIVNYIPNSFYNKYIFSFPTKYHYRDKSDIELIKKSCNELMNYLSIMKEIKTCVIPRPGCGCGELEWNFVKEQIKDILDNKIYIITNEIN